MPLSSQAVHIVLVEDDSELAEWVREFLEQQDMRVSIAERGDTAVDMIRELSPDLVLLDIMLPGKDGHQVCREVRQFYQQPILILTANDGELDEVLALELGADDFIPKPVRPRVLLARIKALLRRNSASSQKSQDRFVFGTFEIDAQAKKVTLQGQTVSLSSTEFDLLWVLANHAGEVMHRNDLVQLLRGFDYDGFDRTIDVRISRLRKKLGDTSQEPERIKTVWGKGYLFVPTAWE